VAGVIDMEQAHNETIHTSNAPDHPGINYIRTEDALRLIYAAIEQANDAIVITTADVEPPGPRIVYANPAFTQMTGYSAEELIGNSPRILQGPQSSRVELDRVRQALARGEAYHGEIVNYRKDGSTYILTWHMDPVRDTDGTITHWVAIQRDITAAKAAEVERIRLFEQTQAAIRVRDELLMIVSHELKTPLTSLMGYTHILQRQRIAADQEQRAIQVIAKQAQRLNTLIDAMLDLERLETGTLRLDHQPVDLRALAEAVVVEYHALLKSQQTLTLTGSSGPLIVQGDQFRLRHVLQHLLQNAIMYSPSDGNIDVVLTQQGEHACMVVQDQGIGIPAAALPYVFERFHRGSNVNPLQVSGFGVGLYIVHEIVTRHGGTVTVDSVEGQGSTFTICLPLV
jgi:PAS domain S-box-containing protein